ncbi:MAG: flavodoxin domain-containing protein [Acidimicrobiia bacterium]
MRSVVVYESKYGNTAEIAAAIAEGLRVHGEAEALTVAAARTANLDDVDLLVVGTPTHAWGLPRTRTWAADDRSVTPVGMLVRAWLEQVPDGRDRAAAAFATRLGKPRLVTGSADGGIARRLRRRHWRPVARESFCVHGSDGPLVAGEPARARAWGETVGCIVEPAGATC